VDVFIFIFIVIFIFMVIVIFIISLDDDFRDEVEFVSAFLLLWRSSK